MPTGYLRNHFFMFVFNLAPLWHICLTLKETNQFLILLLGRQHFADLFFLMFLSSFFLFSCYRLVSPQKASWGCPFFWKLSTGVVQTAHVAGSAGSAFCSQGSGTAAGCCSPFHHSGSSCGEHLTRLRCVFLGYKHKNIFSLICVILERHFALRTDLFMEHQLNTHCT